MTYIKKMKMHGFKSFAKPIDMPFSKDFSTVIGPNGSGKSCHYNTLLIKEDGSEVKIGDLVEKQLKRNSIKTLKDGIYCGSKNPIKIISINKHTLKQEIKEVSKFIKRKGEKLYNLQTTTGKEVKATGCHPVMVFRNGKLKSTLIKDLKEQDLIATPRKISIKNRNNFDRDKARFIGYLIGDGYISSRIEFINKDIEILEDFRSIVNSIYGDIEIVERDDKGTSRLFIKEKSIINEIRTLLKKNHEGSITSKFKKIPNEILSSDKEVIRNVVSGLYDTDGSIRKDIGVIEFCSKNKSLTQQVQRLLLRFGIMSNIKLRMNCASNTENKIKRPYWYLYIYGQENLQKFYINIPLRCSHKKETLEKHVISNKTPNPNNDLLPKETNLYVKNLVQLLGIKLKNERKQYPKLAAYYEDRCNPSRQGIQEALIFFNQKLITLTSTLSNLKIEKDPLIEALSTMNISNTQASLQIGLEKGCINNSWIHRGWNGKQENLQNLQSFIQTTITDRLVQIKQNLTILKNLATSDIYWDRITSIEKTEKVPYVYDLTIPNNHNFIGNGIFVHNSNIVDSLCFVLGRLSSKSMRAEKSSNLIYNGGKKGKAAKEAYVSIVFDNSQNTFPVKAREIEVKRLVRYNGQSKYFLNGELRTRQQILDVLATAKIDPDGHNIILQGDITHAAEMPSEERRKILEDISGISVYENKKLKAVNELEKVDSQLKEASIVLTERATYLKELKKDYDQASHYKDLEKNVKRNKATYLNLQIKSKEEKLNKVTASLNKNQSQIDSIKDNIAKFTQESEQKQQELDQLNAKIDSSGELSQQKLHREIETLKDSLMEDNTRLSTLKNEINSINQRKSQLSTSLKDSDKRVFTLEKNKTQLQSQIEQLNKEHSKLKFELESLKEKYKLDDLETNLIETDQKIDSLKSTDLGQEKLNLLRNKDELTLELTNLEKTANPEQLSKLKELKQEFKTATDKLNSFSDQDSTLVNQLSSARIKLQQFQEQQARLKTRQSLAKENSSYNTAVKKIQSLNISGVYGTISELAEVPEKYSLALEIAAGSRLNSIVVKDDKTAAKCIQYLKTNKLGTAIFLPLNKLKPLSIKKTNQGHGLALDLIKFNSKYSSAFKHVFSNTLVVDDIKTARKIGMGKQRMVTLDGDLVEASGVMIGGFRRKRVSFVSPDLDKNLNNATSEIIRLKSVILTLEKQRSNNDSQLNKLREEKSQLEGEIIKIQASVGNLEDVESKKASLTENLTNVNTQLKELESNLKNKSKILEDLTKKRTLLKSKIDKQRSPELISKINSLESQLQKNSEKKILLTSEIKNITTQIEELILPEKESMGRIIKQHSSELKQFNEEIQELETLIKQKNSEIKEKSKQEAQLYTKFKGLLTKRDASSTFLQKQELKINNEQNKTQIFDERINNLNLDKAKVISELTGLRQEFEEFKSVPLRKGLAENQLRDEINKFEALIKNLGNVNLRALEIYKQVQEEYKNLTEKSSRLSTEKEDVFNMIAEVESKKTFVFMKTFNEINKNFETIFSQLTTKGTAQLVLENPEKPLEEGVQIMVKIAQNKYLDIKSLSGGEKTLTALAFIFSIQEHDPASFYLLDEVDAALDKKNSEKLSELIKKYSSKAQYIVISHNDPVISGADKLYGVSMHKDGISHVVSLEV